MVFSDTIFAAQLSGAALIVLSAINLGLDWPKSIYTTAGMKMRGPSLSSCEGTEGPVALFQNGANGSTVAI